MNGSLVAAACVLGVVAVGYVVNSIAGDLIREAAMRALAEFEDWADGTIASFEAPEFDASEVQRLRAIAAEDAAQVQP